MNAGTLNQTDGGHEALLHRRDHLLNLLNLGRDGRRGRRDFSADDEAAMEDECHEDGQVRQRQPHDLRTNQIKILNFARLAARGKASICRPSPPRPTA